MSLRSLFMVAALLACLPWVGLGVAHAGTLSTEGWASSACGARPGDVPKPDAHSVETYNASLRKINDYRQRLRDHVDCVVREANADIQRLGQAAKAIQQSAREADEQLQLEVKAAREKLD